VRGSDAFVNWINNTLRSTHGKRIVNADDQAFILEYILSAQAALRLLLRDKGLGRDSLPE